MDFLKHIWTTRLAPLFGVDLRSLALFRFSLGAVLLVDTLRRLCDVRAFYSDEGVLPRAWIAEVGGPWRWSLHLANGQPGFQIALILLMALAAFALMLGWRTRLATLVAWALSVSIAARNPMVLLGGDFLINCLLFWSLFLPLAARWSVDAALATNRPPQHNFHLSWASAAIVVQVLSVYFFSALMKTGAEWHPDYTAVYYALSLDSYLYPPGRLLLQWPQVMQALSFGTYWLELLGPLLVLLPLFNRPLRFGVMVLLMLLHVGLIFTMAIGHFPFVSLASLTLLLGGWFWDWRERARNNPAPAAPLRIYYDRDCAFCLKSVLLMRELLILPRAQLQPAQEYGRADKLMQANNSWVVIDHDDKAYLKWSALVVLLRRSPLLAALGRLLATPQLNAPGDRAYDFVARHRARFGSVTAVLLPQREVLWQTGRFAQRAVAVLLFATLTWNLTSVGALPRATQTALGPLIYPLGLDQVWDMFAPTPLREDGWYVLPGTLADGTELDVLKPEHRPARFDKPESIALDWPNFRWHHYQLHLWEKRYAGYRLYWGRYLCERWNSDLAADSPQRLMKFNIVYMLETTQPDFRPAAIEQQILWRHECHPAATTVPATGG